MIFYVSFKGRFKKIVEFSTKGGLGAGSSSVNFALRKIELVNKIKKFTLGKKFP